MYCMLVPCLPACLPAWVHKTQRPWRRVTSPGAGHLSTVPYLQYRIYSAVSTVPYLQYLPYLQCRIYSTVSTVPYLQYSTLSTVLTVSTVPYPHATPHRLHAVPLHVACGTRCNGHTVAVSVALHCTALQAGEIGDGVALLGSCVQRMLATVGGSSHRGMSTG